MRIYKEAIWAAVGVLCLACSAKAGEYTFAQEQEYSIASVEVNELPATVMDVPSIPVLPPITPINPVNPTAPGVTPAGGVSPAPATGIPGVVNPYVETIDKIVNLGKKIFDIIKENQPVVNISVDYANAVPDGEDAGGTLHWTHLQNWSEPRAVTYEVRARNIFGVTLAKVIYQVVYTYGGDYYGRGQFLTAVSVQPLYVTSSGFNIDLSCEVPDMTVNNIGTSEDPIAALQLNFQVRMANFMKEINSRFVYYIKGTGECREIGSPFMGRTLDLAELKTAQTLID